RECGRDIERMGRIKREGTREIEIEIEEGRDRKRKKEIGIERESDREKERERRLIQAFLRRPSNAAKCWFTLEMYFSTANDMMARLLAVFDVAPRHFLSFNRHHTKVACRFDAGRGKRQREEEKEGDREVGREMGRERRREKGAKKKER
nr:hypothetical protein [Tanacetum cinerariifolium]